MSEYINKLIQEDKLSLSVDKSKTFGFKLGDKYVGKDKVLISGPCSVESRDMIVDWSQELKELGVDAHGTQEFTKKSGQLVLKRLRKDKDFYEDNS